MAVTDIEVNRSRRVVDVRVVDSWLYYWYMSAECETQRMDYLVQSITFDI